MAKAEALPNTLAHTCKEKGEGVIVGVVFALNGGEDRGRPVGLVKRGTIERRLEAYTQRGTTTTKKYRKRW